MPAAPGGTGRSHESSSRSCRAVVTAERLVPGGAAATAAAAAAACAAPPAPRRAELAAAPACAAAGAPLAAAACAVPGARLAEPPSAPGSAAAAAGTPRSGRLKAPSAGAGAGRLRPSAACEGGWVRGEGGPERTPSDVSPSSSADGGSAGKSPRTGSIEANVVKRCRPCSSKSLGYLPKNGMGAPRETNRQRYTY